MRRWRHTGWCHRYSSRRPRTGCLRSTARLDHHTRGRCCSRRTSCRRPRRSRARCCCCQPRSTGHRRRHSSRRLHRSRCRARRRRPCRCRRRCRPRSTPRRPRRCCCHSTADPSRRTPSALRLGTPGRRPDLRWGCRSPTQDRSSHRRCTCCWRRALRRARRSSGTAHRRRCRWCKRCPRRCSDGRWGRSSPHRTSFPRSTALRAHRTPCTRRWSRWCPPRCRWRSSSTAALGRHTPRTRRRNR